MTGPWLSEWPPLPPGVYLRRASAAAPFPLGEPDARLYGWGRTALWHGLRAVGLGPGDEVLVPAYHHGAEVGALERAGLTCRFFEATPTLAPDATELEAMLGPRVRALYLIHHLGFPQDADRWRRWCDERGLLLIEDVAMSWLASHDGRPLGSWGDVSIFSPWKVWGLPDLGILLCRDPPAQLPARRRVPVRSIVRGHGKWLAQRWGLIGSLAGRGGPARAFDPAHDFDVWDPDWPPSAASLFLMRRLIAGDPAAERRAAYGVLFAALGEHVPEPFAPLHPESCPFAFPMTVADKPAVLRALGDANIQAINLWSVPHPSLPVADFPHAARMRATRIALPVHQELRPRDLQRMIDVVTPLVGSTSDHGAVTARPTATTDPLLAVGDAAPDFALCDQDGRTVRLSGLAGRTVVVYFYPEADTPGCTAQACGIRDRAAEFDAAGATVLGVSPDPPAKLARFAGRYGLPYTLLADERHAVAEAYGVWVRRSRLGVLARWENQRTTFIIGPDGVVLGVLRDVDPRAHDALVLDALRSAPAP